MNRWILIGLILGVACGETTSPSDCLTQFPAEDGFDFASDGGATVDDVQADCAAQGGTDCEVVVTRAAADCLADDQGIGTEGRTASLVYHTTYEAVVWNVQDEATSTSTPYPASGGTGVTLRASTGEVLATYNWSAGY